MAASQKPGSLVHWNSTAGPEDLNLNFFSSVKSFPELQLVVLETIHDRLESFTPPDPDGRLKAELLQMWKEEAVDFVNRFAELQQLFGLVCDVSALIEPWTALHCAGILIDNIKYSVNVAFCRHFRIDEVPEKIQFDLGLDLFPKPFRVCLGRLRADCKFMRPKSMFLINSLFQGWKKGLLPMEIPKYDKALMKHKKALCDTDGDISEEMGDDIERIASDLLGKFNYKSREKSILLPSTKATYEYNYTYGGSFGKLVSEFYQLPHEKDLSSDESFSWRFRSTLDRDFMTFLAGYSTSKSKWNNPQEIRSYGPTCYDIKEMEFSQLRDSLFDDFIVKPSGVFEPLKIRMITKPTYRTHWGLRGLQQQLIRYLGRFPMFAITADSNKDHLESIVSTLTKNQKATEVGFNHFVSGDYSGATDNQKSEATQIVWDVIGKRIPWWLYHKGKQSLLNTQIDYDVSLDTRSTPYRNYTWERDPGTYDQRNGQLMGNILSFPLLCIINYISWHYTMEQYLGRKHRVRQLSEYCVKVNGDDILFRSNTEFYTLWKTIIPKFGYYMSLGKNFFHELIFQINSQLFKVEFDIWGEPCGSSRISYFNFGLLTGRKKGMSSDDCKVDLSPRGKNRRDSQGDSPAGHSGTKDNDKQQKELFALRMLYIDRLVSLGSFSKELQEQIQCLPTKGLRPKCLDLYQKWFSIRYGRLLSEKQKIGLRLPVELGGLELPGKVPVLKYGENHLGSLFHFKRQDASVRECYPDSFSLGKFDSNLTFREVRKTIGIYDLVDPRKDLKATDAHERGKFSPNL